LHPSDSLIKLLVSLGILKETPTESVLASRPECPLRALARLGMLEENEAIIQIAEELKCEYLDLEQEEVKCKFDVENLMRKLDGGVCWQHKVVPLYSEDSMVVVAFANPLDLEAVEKLQFSFAQTVRRAISEEAKIIRLLDQYVPRTNIVVMDSVQFVHADSETESVEILSGIHNEEPVDVRATQTPPIIRLCNKILFDAVKADASDIHVEPTVAGIEIRFRVDGVMHSIFEVPKRLRSYLVSRFKLLAEMDISEKRRPQDGRLRIVVEDEMIDMRVSSVPTTYGEKLVLRLLRWNDRTRSVSELNLPKKVEKALRQTLDKRGKILLVTGPTGSGKSTTLYTCLQYLKDGTTNIQTVEDPIEFRIPGINQVQVNEQIDVTFASALRSILRQDPDVIMIGEIRDSDTAEIAFQAAQTGHLVLSTLHTNDAISAVSRLKNLDLEPYVISTSLAGVLAQRLVRTLCKGCQAEPSKEYLEQHRQLARTHRLPLKYLTVGAGCAQCNYTGYRGRLGIYSYLDITNEISGLIHADAPLSEIEQAASKIGFIELHRSALQLVRSGTTSFDEVRAYLRVEETEEMAEKSKKGKRSKSSASKRAAKEDSNNEGSTTDARGQSILDMAKQLGTPPEGGTPPPPQPQYTPPAPPVYQQPYQQPAQPQGYQGQAPPPHQHQGQGAAPPGNYPQQGAPPPQYQSPQQPPAGFVKPRILLIEDDQAIRDLFAAILIHEMFEVVQAQNGQEGLQKVYECHPDVIICDLMMPVMNGKEFLQRMKSNKQTREIPIIILTAQEEEEHEIDLLELGATDFVNKSSSHKVMLSRLRKVLNAM